MQLRSRLQVYIILALLLVIIFTGDVQAQNTSAVSQLDKYESHLYMRTFNDESVIQRLERIEVDVLGQKQQGALFQRLRSLEKKVNSVQTGNVGLKNNVTKPLATFDNNENINSEANIIKKPRNKDNGDIPGLYSRVEPGIKQEKSLPTRNELIELKEQKKNDQINDLNSDNSVKEEENKKTDKKKKSTEEELNKEPEKEFDPEAASYFDTLMYVNKDKVIRWKKMPIKIYLPVGSNITYREDYRNAAIRAFNLWKVKSDGVIDYVLVDNPKKADIEVVWQEHFPESMEKAEETTASLGYNVDQAMAGNIIGSSSMFIPGYYGYAASLLGAIVGGIGNTKKIRDMKLRIGTLPAMKLQKDAAMNVIESIASHEYGHALGLSCHSVNEKDVMYYEVLFDGSEAKVPTARDVKTMIELYNTKAEITD